MASKVMYDREALYSKGTIDTVASTLQIGALRPREVQRWADCIGSTFDVTIVGSYGAGDVLGLILDTSLETGMDPFGAHPDTLARANEFARWLIVGENELLMQQGER